MQAPNGSAPALAHDSASIPATFQSALATPSALLHAIQSAETAALHSNVTTSISDTLVMEINSDPPTPSAPSKTTKGTRKGKATPASKPKAGKPKAVKAVDKAGEKRKRHSSPPQNAAVPDMPAPSSKKGRSKHAERSPSPDVTQSPEPARKKRQSKRIKRTSMSDSLSSSSGDLSKSTHKKAKGKGKCTHESDSESKDITIHAFIQVLEPGQVISAPGKRGPAKMGKPQLRNRGLVNFTLETDFQSFIAQIAAKLKTTASHIIIDKMEWKPSKPTNGAYVSLSDEEAFKYLQSQFSSQSSGTAGNKVLIKMPPPHPQSMVNSIALFLFLLLLFTCYA